jgi:hypothetical protein
MDFRCRIAGIGRLAAAHVNAGGRRVVVEIVDRDARASPTTTVASPAGASTRMP